MPVFTATATALLASTALAGSFIATNLLASGLAYGAGHLLGAFDVPEFDTSGSEDQGVDVRLAANTQNRLPILYGEWMDRGRLVYAEVSDDKQNYHSVIALGEGPVDSIDKIFWNEYELSFDGSGVVTNAVAPDGTATTQYNGLITIQTYLGTATGNNSTYLENLSSTWTSTDKMTNIVYAVVSIKYDRDAGVTSLADIRFVGSSPVTNPANAIEDLLTNSRYGLGLTSADINSASFTAAADYFDEMVDYVDLENVTVQQTRHTVNGSLSTNNDVISRIQSIGRGCNAELTWSDGQWGLFVNRQGNSTQFEFDTSNILGNIQVVEPGLNSLFNRVEINFGRNAENNYQRASSFVESPVAVLYPNELTRTQSIDLPLVNTSQEAKRTATVNLNQARQQLTVSHTADATAMPLEAGDIVRYTDADYGWSSKLFRITSITEVNEEASLTYQVTAVEYADAVYNFVVNEDDIAPNVPENDVDVIEAVDDLAVSGQFPNRSVPAIQLTWTVPSNSLIETFDIFYSVGGTQFDSATTIYAKSTVPTAATYTAGDTVVEEVANIPSGNITFWVVGRNDFARSSESNAVTITNYQPNPTAAADTVFRFNETPSVISGVNIDVGAPPANATGVGTGRNNNVNDTGWYISDLDAANRENAPAWTATTTVVRAGAEPRELDFALTGTSGDIVTTETPTNQIIDFELNGTIGENSLQYVARPEITQFTFSGQAAEADSVDPGLQEVWQIDVTGTTQGQQSDTNEEFYLLPAGTSDTFTGEQFIFTPNNGTTGAGAALPDITLDFSNNLFTPGDFRITIDGTNVTNGQVFSNQTTSSGFSEIGGVLDTQAEANALRTFLGVAVGGGQTVDDGVSISITDGTGTFTVNNLRTVATSDSSNFFNFIIVDVLDSTNDAAAFNVDGTFSFGSEFTITLTKADGATITIDGTTRVFELATNLSGAVAIGTSLNTAIGSTYDSDFTKTFDAVTGVITLTSVDADDHTGSLTVFEAGGGNFSITTTNNAPFGTITTIQLQVSELTIDETIELASNVTGQPLLDDIEAKLLANTAITNQFTVSQDTATIDGNSVTIVKLVAIPIQDLSLAISINSGITGTTSGTLVDGLVSQTATSITLTYDPDILPVTQMITFGENATSAQVATELTALIDGHGDLEATQGDTFTQTEQVINSLPVPGSNSFFADAEYLGLIPGLIPGGESIFRTDSITVKDITEYIHGAFTVPVLNSYVWIAAGPELDDPFAVFIVTARDTNTLVATLEYVGDTGDFGDTMLEVGSTYYRRINIPVGESDFIFTEAVVSTSFNQDITSSSILIKPDITGNQTQPVITVTTQGSGDASFAVSTQLEGRTSTPGAPAFTSYTIIYDNTILLNGVFGSARNATGTIVEIRDLINDTTELTAVVSGSTLTVTSTINSAADVSISIVAGINQIGKTSTNDLATSRSVINHGSATDVFAGTNTSITVRVSGEVYYTGVYTTSADTIATILADLEIGIDTGVPGFDLDERWNGNVFDDNTLRATAIGTGTGPTIAVSIAPGTIATSDAIGNITTTLATLTPTRTIVDDGQQTDIVTGELSNFTVVQGTNTLVSAMDITGSSSANSVATQIAAAIGANPDSQYTTSVSSNNILATLIENNSIPDLTITISAGKNADDTVADLSIAKTINQVGNVGTTDLTNAVWTYYISAPTTDGDTTMINSDGTIAVRRGLFLNSLASSATDPLAGQFVVFNDTFTTSSLDAVYDLFCSTHVFLEVGSTTGDEVSIFAAFQYTDDVNDLPNATWSGFGSSTSNGVTVLLEDATNPIVGARIYATMSLALDNVANEFARSTEYALRVQIIATQDGSQITIPDEVYAGISSSFLLQEILTT